MSGSFLLGYLAATLVALLIWRRERKRTSLPPPAPSANEETFVMWFGRDGMMVRISGPGTTKRTYKGKSIETWSAGAVRIEVSGGR